LELLVELRDPVGSVFTEGFAEESPPAIFGLWLVEPEKMTLRPRPTTTKIIIIKERSIWAYLRFFKTPNNNTLPND